MSFKSGSLKTVNFDPSSIAFSSSDFWMPSDTDAIFRAQDEHIIAESPKHLWPYFNSQTLSMVVGSDGTCSLSGFDPVRKARRVTTSLFGRQFVYYDFVDFGGVVGYNFNKRPLSAGDREFLRLIQGYPVKFSVKLLSRNAFGKEDASSFYSWDTSGLRIDEPESNNDYPNLDYIDASNSQYAGTEFEVVCFLGFISGDGSTCELLNLDGSPFKWPKSITINNIANFGSFPASLPSDVPKNIKAKPFDATGINNYRFRSLMQISDRDSSGFVNAVSGLTGITMAGRNDSNGVIQDVGDFLDGVSVGNVEINVRLFNQKRADFSKSSFKAQVVSSELQAIEIDDVSGTVVRNYRHVLILSVPDRDKAGLADLPRFASKPEFYTHQVDGRGFFLSSVTETDTNEVILVLTSEAG